MKKLIQLFALTTIGFTPILSVIACGSPQNNNPNQPNETEQANLENLVLTSSNLVKPLLLSKDFNLSTNRLINHNLSMSHSNIRNLSQSVTGNSYEQFVETWGYNQTIDGYNTADFKADTDSTTFDSKFNQIKANLQPTFDSIKTIATNPIFQILINVLKSNKSFKTVVDEQKPLILDNLWKINQLIKEKKLKQYINFLPAFVATQIKNLTGQLINFNPENFYGTKFKKNANETESIKNTLFDNNKTWWEKDETFKNCDSIQNNSAILNSANFQTWDQVALYQIGMQINHLIKEFNPDNNANLSDVFQAATAQHWNSDNTAITGIDKTVFTEQLAKIAANVTKNIKLKIANIKDHPFDAIQILQIVNNLIPIVKYFNFGFKPTTAVKLFTNKAPTNAQAGIVNLAEITETTLNFLTNPHSLSELFQTLLTKPNPQSSEISNYLMLDVTVKNQAGKSFAFNQVNQIDSTDLKNDFSKIAESLISNQNNQIIKDIITLINQNLIKTRNQFDLTIDDINATADLFAKTGQLLSTITNYDDKAKMTENWDQILTAIGYQPDENATEFKQNSLLAELKNWINRSKITTNIPNFLQFVVELTDNLLSKIPYLEIDRTLDIQNQNYWTINQSTVKFNYDSHNNQSTLSYQLINIMGDKPKPIQITIISDGNAKINGKDNNLTVKIKEIRTI